MIDPELGGQVVLACGCTAGAGRAAARLFAAEGAWVAVAFRSDIAGAKSLVDEIRAEGGRAIPAPGDVSTPEGAWTLARYVEHEWARIDVLLHANSLATPDEQAPDPTPILTELAPAMRERGVGRAVVLQTDAAPGDFGRILADQYGGPGLLVNAILLPPAQEQLYEPAARAALFLASPWNSGMSGTTLDLTNRR